MQPTNKSRLLFFALSVVLVVPLLFATLLGARALGNDDEGDSLYKYLSVFTEVLRLVRQVYVEDPDIRQLMVGALDGAADALDPFSMYVPAEQVDGYLQVQNVGRSRSGVMILKERGVAYVVTVDEGSPAAVAGLRRADIVSRLQGRSSREMPLWQIGEVLAGRPGTPIEMELVRQGNNIEVTFELAVFDPPESRVEEVRGVPVMRISEFSSRTTRRVGELLGEVEGDRLIIDLRGIAGGDPEQAYAVAEQFTSGNLGALVGSEGLVKRFSSSVPSHWQGEIGVLVDRGSQGSAEILASILHLSAGATLVGERTFGHAGESELVRLATGAYLQLTKGFYTGPDEVPLNEGLVPEVAIENARLGDDAADTEDRALERALDLLLEEQELVLEDVA